MNAIEAHHLTRKFSNITAVDDLNLSIAQGQCFALLGINGAGKTTAIRMFCGLIPPSEGDVQVLGHSIVTDALNARALLNLSPQETAIAPNLTVLENLELDRWPIRYEPASVPDSCPGHDPPHGP